MELRLKTLVWSLALFGGLLGGCGDDESGGDEGASAGEGSSGMRASAGEGSSGMRASAGSTSGDDSSTGELVPISCGPDLVCDAGQACIRTPQDAACTSVSTNEENPQCPDGTMLTACGGAGGPCCCGPTPPPTYACIDAPECGGPPTCECLAAPCDPQEFCSNTTNEGEVICEIEEA
ncbi:MAG: hypothetical protein AAGA54_25150 [Myxococcota bacterium]